MISEHDIIRMLSSSMPRGPDQQNRLFESDSEIIKWQGTNLLFSADEFSAEDLLVEKDPFTLGWNCAAGTLSDIYACGGTPLWYMHSMTCCPNVQEKYIAEFAHGISSVLKKADISFIGGDLSRNHSWHYTGFVIGTANKRPIMRSSTQPGDLIYMTGPAGMGNIQAAINLFHLDQSDYSEIGLRFRVLSHESSIISSYASSCIDTSDGVLKSLNALSNINNTGFNLDTPVYSSLCQQIAEILSVPIELFLLGESGEYELLFTVPPDTEDKMLKACTRQNIKPINIGTITTPDIKQITISSQPIDFSSFNISGRDFETPETYLEGLREWIGLQL